MLKLAFETHFFGISDIGLVRQRNEDVFAAYPDKGLYLLADGMGGHKAGEVAAQESVAIFTELFEETEVEGDEGEIQRRLVELIMRVNARLHQKSCKDSELAGMGSTLCALLLREDFALVAHVGDSRIYRYRESILEQLTEDHSLLNELLKSGALTKSEAKSGNYKHVLTQAMGPQATVDPATAAHPLQKGDLFLLCSDGLTNFLSDQAIDGILQLPTSLESRGQTLVDAAKEGGGGDNITVVLVSIGNDLS